MSLGRHVVAFALAGVAAAAVSSAFLNPSSKSDGSSVPAEVSRHGDSAPQVPNAGTPTLPPGVRTEKNLPKKEGGHEGEGKKEEGHALDAMQWWYGTRAFPYANIPDAAYFQGWQAAKSLAPVASRGEFGWNAIGPNNIGGRVLSLAIDPVDENLLWCGTASSGLWKSTTGGEGASAWTLIDTGFPTLSVSAILIEPNHREVMYIGTGEMGRYGRGQVGTPGARNAYGLGVLKSTDAGETWSTTGLTWTFDQSRAIFAMTIDATNHDIVWAATSEGLYKTTDAGDTWTLSHDVLMAMDVVIDPNNGNNLWVSHGQLNTTPNPGIYRTTNGGDSWTLLAGGLPTTDFGRTPLSIFQQPGGLATPVLYAGVSNAASRAVVGLYKSTNRGDTWTRVNSTNWASSQAWYNNAIAVKPSNVNTIICAGLDVYRSTNGGTNLPQVSNWWAGYEGDIPPGGPEGPSDYVHADTHAILWSPHDTQTVYVGCDGGVFKSTNGGTVWAGKNGGLQTTQFYAGLAVSASTDSWIFGGLQDNGTVRYSGNPAWSKVFGGDGGYCGIASNNPNRVYEEYVYLNIHRSLDGGQSWSEIHPLDSASANFIAPFVVSHANPNVIYAGALAVKKSTNGGDSFFVPDGNTNWNGTPMAVIGVAPTSADIVIAATGSSATGAVFELRRTTNGGTNWSTVSAGLPDRFCTDITFHPSNSSVVYITFSGFAASHVFKSTDTGQTWTDHTGNLPDMPVQSIEIDPTQPGWIYAGTDLGVFRSTDDGVTWEDMNFGMPLAMITDLVIRPGTRLMRAATFGNGIYEMELPTTTDVAVVEGAVLGVAAAPNPFSGETRVRLDLPRSGALDVSIFDAGGREVRRLHRGDAAAGENELAWDGRDDRGASLPVGTYFVRVASAGDVRTAKVVRID